MEPKWWTEIKLYIERLPRSVQDIIMMNAFEALGLWHRTRYVTYYAQMWATYIDRREFYMTEIEA